MESVAQMAGIVSKGGVARLEADDKLTPADFAEIAEELGREPLRARKIGYVAARKADKRALSRSVDVGGEKLRRGPETENATHIQYRPAITLLTKLPHSSTVREDYALEI